MKFSHRPAFIPYKIDKFFQVKGMGTGFAALGSLKATRAQIRFTKHTLTSPKTQKVMEMLYCQQEH